MNSPLFSPSPSSLGLFILSVLVLLDFPVSLGNPSELNLDQYNTCSKEFNCGNITGVSYPFWGGDRRLGCGHLELELHCQDDGTAATIEIKGVQYRVLSLNKDAQTLRIARDDYLKGPCSPLLANTTMNSQLYDYAADNYQYITFVYGCPSPLEEYFKPYQISCSEDGNIPLGAGYFSAGSQPQGPGECNVSVSVPVILDLETLLKEGLTKLQNLFQIMEGAIGEGFEVRWKVDDDGKACRECLKSKGVCGYDLGLNQTTCYCKDQTRASTSKACTATDTDTASPPSSQESSPSPPPPSTYLNQYHVSGAIFYFLLLGIISN